MAKTFTLSAEEQEKLKPLGNGTSNRKTFTLSAEEQKKLKPLTSKDTGSKDQRYTITYGGETIEGLTAAGLNYVKKMDAGTNPKGYAGVDETEKKAVEKYLELRDNSKKSSKNFLTQTLTDAWDYVSKNKDKIVLSVPTKVSNGLKPAIPDSSQGLKTGLDLVQKQEDVFDIKTYEPKTIEEKKLYDKYYESVDTLKTLGVDPQNPESYASAMRQAKVIDKYDIDPVSFNQEELSKWATKHGYRYNIDVGWQPAKKVTDEVENDFNVLRYFADNNLYKDLAKKYPIATSVGTVVTAPVRSVIGAMAVVDDAIDTVAGKGIEPYSKLHSVGNNTNTIRQTVGDKYASKWFGGKETAVTGNVGKFTYDTLMSMGDNVANLLTAKAIAGGFGLSAAKTADLTSKITSGLMSSGAAADSISNAKLKGYTDEQALTIGISTGITEYLTEKIPLDNILKTPKSLVKGMLVGFVSEGLEEGASNWANKLTDYLIAGEDSDISMAIEGYISEGKSNKDAILKAIGDSLLDDTRAILSGGFSGMGMSAAYQAPNRVKTNIAGRRIATGKYRDVTLSAVLSKGLSSQDAEIRKKAEIVADMEQGDTKKSQYHYKIGELAMDILSEDKYAFTSADTIKNARRLTQIADNKVKLSEKAKNEMLETVVLGDLTGVDTKISYDSIVGLVKYRTNEITNIFYETTGRELSFEKIFNANLKAVSNKGGVIITDEIIMDYADAFAQSIAKDSTIYTALSEHGDDIGKVIFDTYKQGVSEGASQTVKFAADKFKSMINDLKTTAGTMHSQIYVHTENNSNDELTNTAKQGTIKITENAVDVSPVVNAIGNTIKDGALQSISVYMQNETGTQDWDVFARKIIDNYRATGNIGEVSKYFADGGKAIIEAIENIGGISNERNGLLHEHSSRDDGSSGEQTGEVQGASKEVGSRRQTAEKLRSEGRTEQVNITKDIVCEVIKEDSYTDDMRVVADFLGKYGLNARFMVGEGVNTKKGVSFSGAVTGDNVAYIQYDSNENTPEIIAKHEIGHVIYKLAIGKKIGSILTNSFSKAELENILSKDRYAEYSDLYEGDTNKIFEEFVCDTLAGMNEYTLVFDELVTSFWNNDFEAIDNYEVSQNAEKIESGENVSYALSQSASVEIEKAITDKFYDKEIKLTDSSPSILISQKGVDNLPMVIKASHARENILTEEEAKKLGLSITSDKHFHGLGKTLFLKVIDGLDGVTRAYRGTKNAENSDRRENYFLLISQYKDTNGNTINVPIFINKGSIYNEVYMVANKVATVFGRDNFEDYIQRQISKGNLVKIKNRSSKASEPTPLIGGNYNQRTSNEGDATASNNIPALHAKSDRSQSPLIKDSVPQNDTSVKNNSMQETEKLSAQNEDIRFSVSKQPGVMWTMEQGVLNKNEVAAFYSKVSELRNNKYRTFKKSAEGDYIFPVENKLIYSDADYDYPKIKTVITFETDDENLIDYARECFYEGETYGRRFEDTKEIAEIVLGEGTVKRADYNPNEANERMSNHGKESGNGGETDSRSGEDVKLSVATKEKNDKTTDKDELNKQWDKAVDKYGSIEPGSNPARDIKVPKKSDKTRYVSKSARTLLEAEIMPDNTVDEFRGEVLNHKVSHIPITDKDARKYAFDKINELGFDGAIQYWNALASAENIPGKNDIVLGEVLLNQCLTAADVELSMKIAGDLAHMATIAGQATQAFSMIKKMSPDGKLYCLEKSVQSLNREMKEQLGEKGKDLEIELNKDLARRYLTETDEASRQQLLDEIHEDIAKQIPATNFDKWTAWRYLSMLCNPRTHFRNVVGNAIMVPARKLKNFIGAILEGQAIALGKMEESQRTKSIIRDKNALEFAKKDFDKVGNLIKGYDGKYDIKYGEINERRQIFKNRFLEAVRRFNNYAMEWEDGLFLRAAYVDALAQVMTARNITPEFLNSGTREAITALDNMRKYAIKQAQEATFRDANEIAKVLNEFKRRATKKGEGAKFFWYATFEGVLPFKNTPLNIAKRGIEYSPAYLIKGFMLDAKKVKSGKMTADEMLDSRAKGFTGAALVLIGVLFARLGWIIGIGDEDKKKRKFDETIGFQGYALKLGEYGTYTIDWAAPTVMPIFVGVELWNSVKDDGISFADFTGSISKILEPLMELSCLQGISSVLEAATYYGDNAISAVFIDAATSYIMQAIPTLSGQIARTADKTRRTTYVNKNSHIPQTIQTLSQQIAAKIPVASYMLEPRLDAWGREMTYGENVALRGVSNFVSPGYARRIDNSKVSKELNALYERVGDNSVFPIVAQKSVTISATDVKNHKNITAGKINLTGEQYTFYAKSRGQNSLGLVTELINSPDYKIMSDEEKVEAIKDCYTEAGKIAKEEFIKKYLLSGR